MKSGRLKKVKSFFEDEQVAKPKKTYNKRKSKEIEVESQAVKQEKLEESVELMLPNVALSTRDKATQLTLSEDQLTCIGTEGGYRMVRATHGVYLGSYYYEIEILKALEDNAHVRVGWSTRQAELQAPVGYDKWSFGYADVTGGKVHNRLRLDEYGSSFGPGDVIGCYIHMNEDTTSDEDTSEVPITTELQIPTSAAIGNNIRFFKNGVAQGVAYSGCQIPLGVYYPSVSLFGKAVVRVNFGPTFILKPLQLSQTTTNAVADIQPLTPTDRQIHENRLCDIRREKGLTGYTHKYISDDPPMHMVVCSMGQADELEDGFQDTETN